MTELLSTDHRQSGQSVTSVLNSSVSMLELLEQWVELGWLRALDVALVRFLSREAEEAGLPANPLLLLAIAMTSHQLGRGHVCLDLAMLAQEGFNDALSLPPEDESTPERCLLPGDLLVSVTNEDWESALTHSLLVDCMEHGDPSCPLVRDGLRLYLRRFWNYEQAVFHQISERLLPLNTGDETVDEHLSLALKALFPGNTDDVDWQQVACANAARQPFSVITGGPGTGKTTTVVKLLAALQHAALAASAPSRSLRIHLAAPTGKAAARLNESIAGAVSRLDLTGLPDSELLRASIPTDVTTLHRLLGSVPGSRRFRHDRTNPLVVDVLVVDEASMVDLEMMARVFDALPASARLVLLGDKDQLASVDAGAVLGELCQRAVEAHYRPLTACWLEQATGSQIPDELIDDRGTVLDQAITLLRRSYRFDENSGIGQLAATVNRGCPDGRTGSRARDIFAAGFGDIAKVMVPRHEAGPAIQRHCADGGGDHFCLNPDSEGEDRSVPVGYCHYLNTMAKTRPDRTAAVEVWDQWALNVLEAYDQFQVLTALRKGAFGVEGLNQLIAERLKTKGLISATDGWYSGRPVLVTQNDYSLGLMNGDVGIALTIPARQWTHGQLQVDAANPVLRVAFPSGDGSGGVRWVLPSRLQQVETVFAMTVHKSQGSEFNHACLVLPDRSSPVLTRELVYTGITRARSWFSLLLPDESVFDLALERRVNRSSGLGECLFGQG